MILNGTAIITTPRDQHGRFLRTWTVITSRKLKKWSKEVPKHMQGVEKRGGFQQPYVYIE